MLLLQVKEPFPYLTVLIFFYLDKILYSEVTVLSYDLDKITVF